MCPFFPICLLVLNDYHSNIKNNKHVILLNFRNKNKYKIVCFKMPIVYQYIIKNRKRNKRQNFKFTTYLHNITTIRFFYKKLKNDKK